ncbi:unnamed protein product [Trichogramma brassicae]|uniref:Uncharacterized protein n=1 Tax=Trichogramma brassicae TaxID=86971 RepID=A0A6H5ISE0_9HYME|nr:unnamed protein product [Trichogramma brassicae]
MVSLRTVTAASITATSITATSVAATPSPRNSIHPLIDHVIARAIELISRVSLECCNRFYVLPIVSELKIQRDGAGRVPPLAHGKQVRARVCASPRRAFMKNCMLTSNCLVSLDVPYESGQVMKAASSREPGKARSRERNVCKLCTGPDYTYILKTEALHLQLLLNLLVLLVLQPVPAVLLLIPMKAVRIGLIIIESLISREIRKNTFKISLKIRRKHDFLMSCTSMRSVRHVCSVRPHRLPIVIQHAIIGARDGKIQTTQRNNTRHAFACSLLRTYLAARYRPSQPERARERERIVRSTRATPLGSPICTSLLCLDPKPFHTIKRYVWYTGKVAIFRLEFYKLLCTTLSQLTTASRDFHYSSPSPCVTRTRYIDESGESTIYGFKEDKISKKSKKIADEFNNFDMISYTYIMLGREPKSPKSKVQKSLNRKDPTQLLSNLLILRSCLFLCTLSFRNDLPNFMISTLCNGCGYAFSAKRGVAERAEGKCLIANAKEGANPPKRAEKREALEPNAEEKEVVVGARRKITCTSMYSQFNASSRSNPKAASSKASSMSPERKSRDRRCKNYKSIKLVHKNPMYFITFLNPSLLEDDILQKKRDVRWTSTPNLRSDPRKGYCEESNLVGEVRRRRERSNGGGGSSRTTRKKVFLRRIFYLPPPTIASFLTDFLSIIPLLTPLQAALSPGSLPLGRYAFIFAIFEIFRNASYQPSTLCYHVHRRPMIQEHVNVIHMYMHFIMRQLSRRGSGAFERANTSLFAFSSRIIYRANTHVCVRVYVCEHECVLASTRGCIAMSVHSLYARPAVAQRSEVSSVSRLLRGHTLLASPPELDIFFRTRCLVPSCECGSRFCRRWQVPSLLCRLHLFPAFYT